MRAELRASGLLRSDEDIENAHIGTFGDTIIGMEMPAEASAPMASPSSSSNYRPKAELESKSLALSEAPTEAQLQVSVLNLREPPFVGRSFARSKIQRYLEDVRRTGVAATSSG